jgi:Interleukin-like EMT inducer
MPDFVKPITLLRSSTVLLLFITIWCSRVNYTQSDPQLTLLASQAIIENGSINLYSYKTGAAPEQFSAGKWKYTNRQRNETIYYSYPYGAVFLSIPFVAAGNALGLDMSVAAHDAWMQSMLAALSAILIFLLTDRLLRLLTTPEIAFFISLLVAFGSTYMSTIGSALWSFNYQLIFILLAAIQIIKAETGKAERINPFVFGSLLFGAWLCRPSSLGFIAIAGIWILIRQRKSVLAVSGMLATWFLLFVMFSQQTFGLFLPPYYNPFFWTYSTVTYSTFPSRLMAMLFSPARGLFVFTPLLLFAFGGLFSQHLRKNYIYLGALIWFVVQTLLSAMQPNWWGGWCFGPRLLTDTLPPLTLLLALTVHHWNQQAMLNRFMPGIVVFGCFGLFAHTIQAMYNPETQKWNNYPNIDDMPGYYMWNWKHTQLLASSATNTIKQRELELGGELDQYIKLLKPGSHLLYGAPDNITRLIYERWNNSADDNIKLHNNLYSIEKSNCDTFWITTKNIDEIKNTNYYTILYPEKLLTLGGWLQNNQQAIILLSVRDEGVTSLSNESKAYLKQIGAHPDSLKFRQGYTAIIANGKLIAEKFENNDSAAITQNYNGINIQLRSCGNNTGNIASVKINGHEFAQNLRGFNAVILDKSGKPANSVRFDTHAYDAEEQKILPVIHTSDFQKRK